MRRCRWSLPWGASRMLDFDAADVVILAEPDTAFLMLLFVARL